MVFIMFFIMLPRYFQLFILSTRKRGYISHFTSFVHNKHFYRAS
ncbi:hypothetical protein HMPREF1145_1192 [Oribacterium parvum ACB8]|nr:hypothetical protein HMPREF1145_1192 [Oribacterium parvum ACB8]